MKFIYYIMLICFGFIQNIAAQELLPPENQEKIVLKVKNIRQGNKEGMFDYQKLTYDYDSRGRNTITTSYGFNRYEWKQSEKWDYFYNSLDQLICFIRFFDYGDGWEQNQKDTLVYDAGGNCIYDLLLDYQENKWVNNSYDTIIFDARGNEIDKISKIYRNRDWEFATRNTYLYDENENLIEWSYFIRSDDNWKEYQRKESSYDENNNHIEEIEYNFISNELIPVHKSTMEYDINNKLTAKTNYYQSPEIPYEKISYLYDTDDRISKEQIQNYEENDWADSIFFYYEYNEDNKVQREYQEDLIDDEWIVKYEWLYEYEKITVDVEEQANNHFNSFLRPNPVTQSGLITFYLTESGYTKLEIFNLLGQQLSVPLDSYLNAGKHEVAIDKTDLGPGITGVYYYRIVINNKSEIKPIIFE